MASKAIIVFGLLAIFSLINFGEATINCYNCSSCHAEDVNKTDTVPCEGSCYIVDNMAGSWERGCDVSNYCDQHEGHNMDCSVCNVDLCNSSSTFGVSMLVALLTFTIVRFFN